MTTLQLVSFILLWIFIMAEGGLLMVLYRHVGLLYTPKKEGLALGTQVPPLLARDVQGRTVSLPELLTADRNLLVFGSPTCSGCRAFLTDDSVSRFLSAHAIPSFFLNYSDRGVSAVEDSLRTNTSLQVLVVEQDAFDDYAIPAMPFAYVVTGEGSIAARGAVGEGLEPLMKLLAQGERRSVEAHVAVAPQVSH